MRVSCPALRRDQIEDVGADPGGIGVPLRQPVAVDLPAWARQPVPAGLAPGVQGVVRRAKLRVRAEMRDFRHGAGRRRRTHEPVPFDEGVRYLGPDLDADGRVPLPVERDVAAAPHPLRAKRIPHETTALGNDSRQIGRTRLPLDDRERNTGGWLQTNVVGGHVVPYGFFFNIFTSDSCESYAMSCTRQPAGAFTM